MAGYHLSDEEWIAEWKKIGSPQKFAEIHKNDVRSVSVSYTHLTLPTIYSV